MPLKDYERKYLVGVLKPMVEKCEALWKERNERNPATKFGDSSKSWFAIQREWLNMLATGFEGLEPLVIEFNKAYKDYMPIAAVDLNTFAEGDLKTQRQQDKILAENLMTEILGGFHILLRYLTADQLARLEKDKDISDKFKESIRIYSPIAQLRSLAVDKEKLETDWEVEHVYAYYHPSARRYVIVDSYLDQTVFASSSLLDQSPIIILEKNYLIWERQFQDPAKEKQIADKNRYVWRISFQNDAVLSNIADRDTVNEQITKLMDPKNFKSSATALIDFLETHQASEIKNILDDWWQACIGVGLVDGAWLVMGDKTDQLVSQACQNLAQQHHWSAMAGQAFNSATIMVGDPFVIGLIATVTYYFYTIWNREQELGRSLTQGEKTQIRNDALKLGFQVFVGALAWTVGYALATALTGGVGLVPAILIHMAISGFIEAASVSITNFVFSLDKIKSTVTARLTLEGHQQGLGKEEIEKNIAAEIAKQKTQLYKDTFRLFCANFVAGAVFSAISGVAPLIPTAWISKVVITIVKTAVLLVAETLGFYGTYKGLGKITFFKSEAEQRGTSFEPEKKPDKPEPGSQGGSSPPKPSTS